MKKIILALAISALVCSCGNNGGVKYTVNGNIPELISGMIYLADSNGNPIDSTTVSEGKFTLKGQVEEETGAYLIQYPSFMTLVMLENGNIKIEGSAEEPTLSGTPANDGYQKMNDTFAAMNPDEIEDPEAAQIEIMTTAFQENKDNIFGLYLMENMVFMLPSAETLAAYESLPENFKNREDALKIKERAEKMAATEVGQKFIDIEMATNDGEMKKLSSYVENGDYVLLDFWASWCNPCMVEVPYLVAAYDKYAKKGFEIYGVSLDNDAEAWVNAYESKKMNWIQVSEVNGWTSQAVDNYGVVAIPANFLIAPDGTIIAKNLRGDQLNKKLAEIFE
ncbi:MAG: AhpC/TSA family protein [Tidjanibacter sp.]|nr:AhpC/TSA family protein [Tidjanibacter sp.]MBR6831724.1 AhpC/TSA family protein [Tidjanibacter sp.]